VILFRRNQYFSAYVQFLIAELMSTFESISRRTFVKCLMDLVDISSAFHNTFPSKQVIDDPGTNLRETSGFEDTCVLHRMGFDDCLCKMWMNRFQNTPQEIWKHKHHTFVAELDEASVVNNITVYRIANSMIEASDDFLDYCGITPVNLWEAISSCEGNVDKLVNSEMLSLVCKESQRLKLLSLIYNDTKWSTELFSGKSVPARDNHTSHYARTHHSYEVKDLPCFSLDFFKKYGSRAFFIARSLRDSHRYLILDRHYSSIEKMYFKVEMKARFGEIIRYPTFMNSFSAFVDWHDLEKEKTNKFVNMRAAGYRSEKASYYPDLTFITKKRAYNVVAEYPKYPGLHPILKRNLEHFEEEQKKKQKSILERQKVVRRENRISVDKSLEDMIEDGAPTFHDWLSIKLGGVAGAKWSRDLSVHYK